MHTETVTLFAVPEFHTLEIQYVLLRHLESDGVSVQFAAQGRTLRATVSGPALASRCAAAKIPDWYLGWRAMNVSGVVRWAA